MPRNNRPVIIGAAILGVLAIGLTLMLLMQRPPAGPGPGQGPGGTEQPVETPKVQQFVARDYIAPRTELKATDFIARESDQKEVKPGALTDLSDVVGKISAMPIRKGEAVTGAMIVDPIARVIPANIPIPVGARAVALWVNPNETVAGLVDVGDRVDVIVNHKLSLEKETDTLIIGAKDFVAARTIAQDLPVLAVDRSISAAAAPKPTTQPGGQGGDGQAAPAPTATPIPPAQQANPRIRVVVAASPADAERIVAANQEGTVHLTLRNPASRDRFPIPEAREYPSRMVYAPKKPQANQNTGGNSGGGRARNTEMFPPMAPPSPQMSPPMPAPVAPAPVREMPMTVPDKEVTVIRGTEKTRVIVPR